jgi:hypothetical protein
MRYYYYPNLEGYFDAANEVYYLRVKGEWQVTPEIPSGYRGYSVANKFRVLIEDFDEDQVTEFFEIHKKRYPINSHIKKRDPIGVRKADPGAQLKNRRF